MLFPILAGVGLGTLLIVLARTRRGDELRVLAVGLFVAASLYIGFAVRSGGSRWLLIEASGAACSERSHGWACVPPGGSPSAGSRTWRGTCGFTWTAPNRSSGRGTPCRAWASI